MVFFLSARGQQFEGFRLLIAATMALLILAIILGIVDHLNKQRFNISEQNLFDGVQAAAQSPNGNVVRIPSLSFAPGTSFSQSAFSKASGVKPECIELGVSEGGSFTLLGGGEAVQVNREATVDVFVKCEITDCNPFCAIRFGKKIEAAEPP